MSQTTYFVYPTPMGRITLAAQTQGLVTCAFGAQELPYSYKATTLTNTAASQIQEYLAGKRTSFDLPLVVEGTDFQKQVWNAISNIPYGETRTYKDIAEIIGNPQSFRAVGAAANQNPLPLFIPCHRVVGSDGKLVGYAFGTKIKEFLLNLEKGAISSTS